MIPPMQSEDGQFISAIGGAARYCRYRSQWKCICREELMCDQRSWRNDDAPIEPKPVGHHRGWNCCRVSGREGDAGRRVCADRRSDRLPLRRIHWRLVVATAWYSPRGRYRCADCKCVHRRGRAVAYPSLVRRWLGRRLGPTPLVVTRAERNCRSTRGINSNWCLISTAAIDAEVEHAERHHRVVTLPLG